MKILKFKHALGFSDALAKARSDIFAPCCAPKDRLKHLGEKAV